MSNFRLLFLFGILSLEVLVFSGCCGLNLPSGETSNLSANTILPGQGNQSAHYARQNATNPFPHTALDNLAAAYSSGKINKADFAFLQLQALYEPQNLPSQYRGAPIEEYDISDEIMFAKENWDILSESQKATISNWTYMPDPSNAITIPDTTVSFTGLPQNSKPKTTNSKAINLAYPEPGVTYTIYKMQIIPGKVVGIGLLPQNHSEADKDKLDEQVRLIKKTIIETYPKYKTLLDVEPKNEVQFWVWFNPAGTLGTATIEEVSGDPAGRCRLSVDFNQTKSNDRSVATISHELFHCFQYHIPLRAWTDHDQKWLREATATWAQHYAYPQNNAEHERLPAFFKSREKTLVMREGLKEYSDYVFFYYLQQKAGAETVAQVLKDTKTIGTRPALRKIPDFDHKFAEYSVWNYNKDPILKYTDTPSFPKIPASGLAVSDAFISGDAKQDLYYSLTTGTATFQIMDVPQNSKKILFSFPDFGDDKNEHWAWVKIGNSWEEQDWTHLPYKRFCLDKPEEKVTRIILIHDNSEIDKNVSLDKSYEIDTTGECPKEIGGFTRITYSVDLSGSDAGASMYSDMSGSYLSRDTLQYDEEYEQYVIKTSSKTCTYSESTFAQDQYQSIRSSRSGSGSYAETYDDPSTAPLKIRFDENNDEIDFVSVPDEKDSHWVTYTNDVTITIGGVASPTKYTEKGACGPLSPLPHLYEFKPSEVMNGSNRISGTKTFSQGGITTKVEFDYTLSDK